jgi:hypothetical protein
MDTSMRTAIDALVGRIEAKTKELAELKRTVNVLSRESGEGPVFPEEDLSAVGGSGIAGIRLDQFYGKSPTVAAREFLEIRNRAVSAEDILAALERGGFDFEGQGWKKPDRLRSLSISLSKNSLIFHRLPNGTYGLVKFYPEIKGEKSRKKAGPDEATEIPDMAAENESGGVNEG